MESLLIFWWLYQRTKDPLSLAWAGLAEAIPAIGVALYAGHIVDKFNRKTVALFAMAGITLSSVILFGLASQPENQINYQAIYIAIALSGFSRGFLAPASFASLGKMIPKNTIQNAATWNSSVWQLGMILGPAIGGLIYGYLKTDYSNAMAICFGITTVLLIIATACFSFIQFPAEDPKPANQPQESLGERLSSGLKFVFGHKIILGAISLDLFAVLFGGAIAVLPMFAEEVLHIGTEELGWLRAAPAIGSSLMAGFLAFQKPMKRAGVNLLIAVFGFGVSMIAFGLSTNFWMAFAFLFLSGIFDSVSVVVRHTIMQLFTPEDMRGRVSAVNSMFIGSSNEIGAFESGVMAKQMGLVPSLVFGGCMTLLVVAIVSLKAVSLKRLNLRAEMEK